MIFSKKAYRKGFNDGYLKGLKEGNIIEYEKGYAKGLHDGNPFNTLIEGVASALSSLGESLSKITVIEENPKDEVRSDEDRS